MKREYYAIDENAMRNGSFHTRTVVKGHYVICRYVQGNFGGWPITMPLGMREFSKKEAKALIPASMRFDFNS